jgi:hypothetical protein
MMSSGFDGLVIWAKNAETYKAIVKNLTESADVRLQ